MPKCIDNYKSHLAVLIKNAENTELFCDVDGQKIHCTYTSDSRLMLQKLYVFALIMAGKSLLTWFSKIF